jgi:mono/diheme cytochrome c family protein
VTSRFPLVLVAGCATLAGCSDSFNAGPLKYVENEKLRTDLKDKPGLQEAVRKALARAFGEDPQHIRVPAGAGLFSGGGVYLGNKVQTGEGEQAVIKTVLVERTSPSPNGEADRVPLDGGYALYRTHCLHCHGVSGAGDGPTASFLYPRPRDYRKGLFKFTSTPNGVKPTRDDLRKTVRYGLHGTSMPAFEPLISDAQIEQILDYVIFLSLRGEVELNLIEEATFADEKDPDPLSDAKVQEFVAKVAGNWKAAESQIVNPPIPRTLATRESVLRGRHLFLGGKVKNDAGQDVSVECTSCHGPKAEGNGPSLVPQEVFNDVVFYGDPSTESDRLAKYDEKTRELWKNSLDDWGRPLRANNLSRGIYKGGRRPIDIYWRIAKGINGAKMPAHYPTLKPEQIWDLVNFVLELPQEPKLLDLPPPAVAPPSKAPVPAVARR